MLKPRGVPIAISGRARVRAKDLRAKLGDNTWFVLLALWSHRTTDGTTTITNEGLAKAKGFAKLALEVVRKATKRLKQAALVECVGWRLRDVPSGRGRAKTWVFVRRVLGAETEGSLGAEVLLFVPGDTARWVAGASSWGGARQGAGRRKKNQEAPVSAHENKERMANQEPPTPCDLSRKPASVGNQEYPTVFQEAPTPPNSRVPADLGSYKYPSKQATYPDPSGPDAAATTSAAAVSRIPPSRRETTAIDPLPTGEGSALPTEDGSTPLPSDSGTMPGRDGAAVEQNGGVLALSTPDVGSASSDPPTARYGLALVECGRTRPRPPAMPTSPLAGAPPLPWSMVGLATTPNPPLLEDEMGDVERAHRLADAYRGAVQSRFATKAWALRAGLPIQRSKFFATLLGGAAELLRHEIAPASWAAWSCDVWKEYNAKDKPPPVPWVFSAKRIIERRGWFASEESSYMGGRIVTGPVKREFMERYMRMRLTIDAAQAWDSPQPIVEKFFPADTYDRAVIAARAEVKRQSAEFRLAADSGAFLW